MAYRFLADAVLLVHLAFILFVVFGALLVARRHQVLPVHLAAAAWGVGIEVLGAVCPLTHVENRMRMLAGGSGYSGSFVDHYLLPFIYPGELTRGMQLGLAAGVLVINAAIYFWIFRRPPRGMDYSTQAKPSRASSANDSAGPQEPAA